MLTKEKVTKNIKGIKVIGSIYLTHTLFVDYVLIFGDGSVMEWLHIKSLIDIFCGETRMSISGRKYAFSYLGIKPDLINMIALHRPYNWKHMDEGFHGDSPKD